MATLMSSLISQARSILLEPSEVTGGLWTDAELLAIGNKGVKDMWKSIIDLFHDHFVTLDITNMSISASTSTITGVPTDLFRVLMIQPRTLGNSSTNPGLVFKPRTLTHPDFVQANAMRPVNPRDTVIYYAILNAGAPVAAPTIRIAPQVSSAVSLEVQYVPVLADAVLAGSNPIPGEADMAIINYIIAFARCKSREDRSPDPEYLSIYATEKRNTLVALTPRSDQEPDVVQGFWEPNAALVSETF
jgi:hypothetical protein